MGYLFLVNIGPVQDFIASARRTRDLKFGSSFLSKISWEVARTIRETCGAKSLIFPSIPFEKEDKPDDVPNKILAYIDTSPESVAKRVEEAIKERVVEIRNSVFQKIDTHFDDEGAERQIADLVEYVWVAVEYDLAGPGMRYYEARQKLEALMAARKNTRDFDCVTWGSAQPKSSINGLLESVILENTYPLRWSKVEKAVGEQRERLKSEYMQKSEALRRHFDAGPHEKLSGVDLLKRLGPITSSPDKEKEEDTFPSTSHMAALPFLGGLPIKCW